MKALRTVFISALLAATSLSIFAQGRYNLRVVPQSIDCATNKVVACVEIQATSADSAFVMGDANLRIRFKTDQFSGTPIVKTRDNFSSGDYSSISSAFAGGTDSSFFSLNVVYRGESGSGAMVGVDWTRIACVEFTLNAANTTKCYGLFLSKSNPSTVVRRAVASPTSDNPTRTLTIAVSQGIFSNIANECPSGKAVVSLTGSATINPGQITPLTIKLVSGNVPYTVVLTGGITLSDINTTTTTTNVSPSADTLYEITSVSSACGSGSADANVNKAQITLLPVENCPPAKCVKYTATLVK